MLADENWAGLSSRGNCSSYSTLLEYETICLYRPFVSRIFPISLEGQVAYAQEFQYFSLSIWGREWAGGEDYCYFLSEDGAKGLCG